MGEDRYHREDPDALSAAAAATPEQLWLEAMQWLLMAEEAWDQGRPGGTIRTLTALAEANFSALRTRLLLKGELY